MSGSKATARLVTREVTTTETVRDGVTLHLTDDEAHALLGLYGPSYGQPLFSPYSAILNILGRAARDNPRYVLCASGSAAHPRLIANPAYKEKPSA